MYNDKKRTEAYDEICRRDRVLFAHILTPQLFLQAAWRCGLPILLNPLNLINLVWLAVSAARNSDLCFADILKLSLKTLEDHESFSGSLLANLLGVTAPSVNEKSCHDPRKDPAEAVSEEAFCQARKRMPSQFWVALFFLLAEQFQSLYGDVVRWGRFRLMAVDGTEVLLPDWYALRTHFGTANNAGGTHGAQGRLVLLQFPQARLPYAYVLAPLALGEVSMARQLLRGLSPLDLILLDAGFLCYGLLQQIEQQHAFFCLRLKKQLNMRTIRELSEETGANDLLVQWTPKDSRGQWRKEKLPKSMILRLLTYHVKGFRPMQLLTNVLNEQEVPYEQWWGLSVSEEGEVLFKGIYNLRWEIETTYLELKVQQKMEGNLRSRTAEGIYYEVAGHVLYYLLVRWLMVEAAQKAKVSPLRLSFTEALREIEGKWQAAVVASEEWLQQTLRPRLLECLASHLVEERGGRTAPRGEKARRADKRVKDLKRAKQAEFAKHAKPNSKKKARPRPWFGHGWDLSGTVSNPPASSQS